MSDMDSATRPQRRGPGWKVILVGAGLVLCFGAGLFLIVAGEPVRETKVRVGLASAAREGIGVVTISGVITTAPDYTALGVPRRRGADAWVRRLESCRMNSRVKAVVLRIDSPGGRIAAVQELTRAIRRVQEAGKPVVASFADVAASGGYYIAAGADRIVANPGTMTGSIGVIMGNLNFAGLMKKHGVSANVIKSGKHKDALSPYRPMTAEERRLLQEVIDDCYDQFLREVSRGRKIPVAKLRRLADGRIFTGRQAKRLGLVDELGGFREAKSIAGELAGLGEDPPVVAPDRIDFRDYLGFMQGRSGRGSGGFALPGETYPQIAYLCPVFIDDGAR